MFQVACLLLIYPGGALMGVCLYPLPRSTRYDKSVIIYTIYTIAPYYLSAATWTYNGVLLEIFDWPAQIEHTTINIRKRYA